MLEVGAEESNQKGMRMEIKKEGLKTKKKYMKLEKIITSSKSQNEEAGGVEKFLTIMSHDLKSGLGPHQVVTETNYCWEMSY